MTDQPFQRDALIRIAEAALLDAMGDGFDHVALKIHKLDSGRVFYGVNLHSSHHVQSAHGDTLAKALAGAIADTGRYYPPSDERVAA